MNSDCATQGDLDGGQKYAEVCSIQKYIGTTDGYSYVGDEAVGTARFNDWYKDLEGFTGATDYPAGRKRVAWVPSGGIPVPDSCINYTANLSYKGVGLNASTSICEDYVVPEIGDGKMAVRWSGESSDPVGISYTQVIKKKVGTSNAFTVGVFTYAA